MDLLKALNISTAGLKAQSSRMRIIAENLANSSTTATSPEGSPYRRKTISFRNILDRETSTRLVKVAKYDLDQSSFPKRHDPNHPAADDKGFVQLPNVTTMTEMMDMQEAQRSYEANLSVIEAARGMLQRTIDLLR